MCHRQGAELFRKCKSEEKIGYTSLHGIVFWAKSSLLCSNFARLQTGVDNKKIHLIAARAIQRNFYMDDFAESVATVGEAVQVQKRRENYTQNGGFKLLKLICSYELATGIIQEEDRSEPKTKTFEVDPYASSLLGMQWNVKNETLKLFCSADNKVSNKITQRSVLSFMPLVFELLTLFAWFKMRLRFLLTTIQVKSGQQPVDKTVGEEKEHFLDWVGELTEMRKMPLRRGYSDKSHKNGVAYFLGCLFGINVYSD